MNIIKTVYKVLPKRLRDRIKETVIEEHKSSIVLTDLKPVWCDKDYVMLYALFKLLEDYVELEQPFLYINWEWHPEYTLAKKEIVFLYKWWKRRKLHNPEVHTDNGALADANAVRIDTRMMQRLIKIRSFLWT